MDQFTDKRKVATEEHTPLSFAFLEQASAQAVPVDQLEDTLRQLVQQAEAAWPGLTVPPADFVRYMAERLPARDDVISSVRALYAGDLYLACGCARGDAAALAAFEQVFVPQIPRYLVRGKPSPDFVDDATQELRVRLFAPSSGPGARTGIASYSGRGPLRAWLRVAALRAAVDLDEQRAGPPARYRFEAQATTPAVSDPALVHLKRQYGETVNRAIERALGTLTAHEATLIAVFFLEQATYGAIARTYHISKRQARRRIETLREKLLEEARRFLAEETALAPSDLDSLIRVVAGDLDPSLVAVLRRSSDPD